MKWENQFSSIDSTELLRTTVEIPHSINSQIKSYEPKTGVLQNTISILVTKLSNELRKSNITIADRYAYQRAITDCTITLGGVAPIEQRVPIVVTSTGPKHTKPRQALSRDDAGGTPKVARKAKGAPKLPDPAKPCGNDGGQGVEGNKV